MHRLLHPVEFTLDEFRKYSYQAHYFGPRQIPMNVTGFRIITPEQVNVLNQTEYWLAKENEKLRLGFIEESINRLFNHHSTAYRIKDPVGLYAEVNKGNSESPRLIIGGIRKSQLMDFLKSRGLPHEGIPIIEPRSLTPFIEEVHPEIT